MQTLIIHTEDNKLATIKQFLQELKVSFEIKTEEESSYNPDFVAKIEESLQQAREGKVHRIKTVDLWK